MRKDTIAVAILTLSNMSHLPYYPPTEQLRRGDKPRKGGKKRKKGKQK